MSHYVGGKKKKAAALKRERFGNKIEDILRGNSIESEISGILPNLQLSSCRERQNKRQLSGRATQESRQKLFIYACNRRFEGE
jgi:hypothetical protein